MTLYDVRLLMQKLRVYTKVLQTKLSLFIFCQIHEYKNPVLFKRTRDIPGNACGDEKARACTSTQQGHGWDWTIQGSLNYRDPSVCLLSPPSILPLTPHPHQLGLHVTHYSIHTGVQWRGKCWLFYVLQVTEIIQKSVINS